MKHHAPRLVSLIALLVSLLGTAAAQSFQNLNFESPVLPLTRDGFFQVAINDAMPGWTGYIGDSRVDRVNYNAISLSAPAITFLGPGALEPVIQGQYRVYLQPGYDGSGTQLINVAIAQSGTISVTALSLSFYLARGTPEVYFAGSLLPATLLGTGPGESQLYGADISAFAGQTGELRFSGSGFLDAISFSTLPVPEPGVAALLALGVGLMVWRGRGRWA